MPLRNVPITYTLDQQRQEINALAVDVNNLTSTFSELVDDRVANLVIPGTGITRVYLDTLGTLTFSVDFAAFNAVARSGSYTDLINTPTIPPDQVRSDWNAVSGISVILNKPSIPTAYTLPTASSSILGGVKVGSNLTIDAQGVLNANTGSYTLPTATGSVLGGIKIGSGLSIDGNGVVSAGGGGSGITDVVQDTTPQLGGNLDTNAFDITGGTSSTIELQGQSSKLRFHFDTLAGLPSATDWHGMFAHVHATGAAYYAHSSSWVQLAKLSDIPSAYTLPTSSTSVLGGVKIDGSTITITSGIISATPGGYILPTATSSVLGGVKIDGSTITITNGVISATGGGTGGGVLSSRTTATATTSSLVVNATENMTITAAKAYSLFKLQTSHASWVRLYTSATSRTADASRVQGIDPSPNVGLIAEIISTAAETIVFTPGAVGWNDDSTPSTNVYASVKNQHSSATAVTVTMTYLKLEA